MKGARLLKDIEETRKGWPDRKMRLSAGRVAEMARTGSASGSEWRMLCSYLQVYVFEFNQRYGQVIESE